MNPQTDLIHLVEADLGPGKKSGRWLLFRCPFHQDHNPSFAVTNGDGQRGPFWQCFSCGKHGDLTAWLMEYRGMTYQEARKTINGESSPGYTRKEPPAPPVIPPDNPPGSQWQERARGLIEKAQAALWSDKGGYELIDWPETDPETGQTVIKKLSALDWLLSRGLTEKTLTTWKIGFIPFDWQDKPGLWGLNCKTVYIPKGILIPCIVGKDTWYLKIRRPATKPKKYGQIPGGRPALYMADELEAQETAIFCEGELDALLLWQEIGSLAGVVTLGSATKELNVMSWGWYLLRTKTRYSAFDLDKAGKTGSEKLDWIKAKRLDIPKLKPFDKDLTDFYRSGGELYDWFLAEIQKAYTTINGDAGQAPALLANTTTTGDDRTQAL